MRKVCGENEIEINGNIVKIAMFSHTNCTKQVSTKKYLYLQFVSICNLTLVHCIDSNNIIDIYNFDKCLLICSTKNQSFIKYITINNLLFIKIIDGSMQYIYDSNGAIIYFSKESDIDLFDCGEICIIKRRKENGRVFLCSFDGKPINFF